MDRPQKIRPERSWWIPITLNSGSFQVHTNTMNFKYWCLWCICKRGDVECGQENDLTSSSGSLDVLLMNDALLKYPLYMPDHQIPTKQGIMSEYGTVKMNYTCMDLSINIPGADKSGMATWAPKAFSLVLVSTPRGGLEPGTSEFISLCTCLTSNFYCYYLVYFRRSIPLLSPLEQGYFSPCFKQLTVIKVK